MKCPIKSKVLALICLIFLIIILYELFISFFFYCSNAYVDTNMINIGPQVSGQIKAIRVQNNQEVAQGTVLVEIDPTPFSHNLQQSILNLKQAQDQYAVLGAQQHTLLAQIDQAESQAHLANVTAAPYNTLYRQNVLSQQMQDESITNQQVKNTSILILKAQVNQLNQKLILQQAIIHDATVAVAERQYELSLTKITAPAAGIITNLTSNVGDAVSAYQPLFGMAPAQNNTNWYVTANYNEKYMSRIKSGQYAIMYLNSNPWEFFVGRVASKGVAVARAPETANNTLPYIEPVVSWIQYPYLFPVRIGFSSAHLPQLYRGADVNLIILR